MLPKSVSNSLVAVLLLLPLTGCLAGQAIVRPPVPERLPVTQNPASSARESVISVPVHIDLSKFLDAANDETVIPKKFDHWAGYIKTPRGVEYRYYAERDHFSLELSDSAQSQRSDHSNALRDWWKGIELSGPGVFVRTALRYKIETNSHRVQCGDGSEWPRAATLSGRVAIDVTPNYGLSAAVNGVTVNTSDSCSLSSADSDVIQEVNNRLTEVVRKGLTDAAARINTMTLKPHVEDAWSALLKPIELGPDAWLSFNIGKMRQGGFSGVGSIVDDTIQIIAKPVIVFGPEPPSASTALPQLEAQPVSSGFDAVADAQIDYETLSKRLANRLKGARINNGEDNIRITNASIYGNGGNEVVIRIGFTGDAQGHVYFAGKPEMNALTQTVHISGLHYDFATEKLLMKNAGWLYHSPFRDFIASETVLEVAPAIDRLRDLLATGLNRPVSPAISMQGTVASVQGIGVFAGDKALYVRVLSDGALNVKATGKP